MRSQSATREEHEKHGHTSCLGKDFRDFQTDTANINNVADSFD